MTQPDVIIVGGGLAGLSVGWHLPAELNVLILERASQVGTEATSQNAGMVRRTGEDPVERALAIQSGRFYAQPPEDWSAEQLSRQTGAVLALARDPYQLHDAVADLRQSGIRVERVSNLIEVAPVFKDSPIREGWLLPEERVADPHALVQGFLSGLSRRSQEIRCRQTVTGLMVNNSRVTGVTTQDGTISCDKVVLAAGAWSSILAQQAGLHRALTPLRRSLIQTNTHPSSHPHHPWCWIDDVGIYVRPETGGWLCSPCDETPDSNPAPNSRAPVNPRIWGLVNEKIQRFFPTLSDLDFRGGWSGLRTFAPDRRPLMGPDPELNGLWWAAGLGGYGVSCSPAIGASMAAWLTGGRVSWLEPSWVDPGRIPLQRWSIRPDGDHHGTVLIDAVPDLQSGRDVVPKQ